MFDSILKQNRPIPMPGEARPTPTPGCKQLSTVNFIQRHDYNYEWAQGKEWPDI